MMDDFERNLLIEQLNRSFMAMPTWAKAATKHAMAAPTNNPETGRPFQSFREVIECASDETLQILRDDFYGNGDQPPAIPVSTPTPAAAAPAPDVEPHGSN